MTFTVTLTELLLGLLILAGVVVLIALAVVLFNAVPSVKSLNIILSNTADLTEDAKVGVADAKVIVSDLKSSAASVKSMVDGNQGTLSSLANIAKAGASMINLVKGNKE